MHRIDTATKAVDLFGAGKHGFRAGDPSIPTPATHMSPDWCNDIQENICRVIEAKGMALAKGDGTQLLQAITAMIQDGAHSVVIREAVFAPGIVNGKPVRWDSGNNRFALAVADGTANNQAVGVADVTNAAVICFGETPAGLLAGLTPGARHYLSSDVAGGIVAAAPADAVVLGIAKAADVLFVDIDMLPAAEVPADIPFIGGYSGIGAGKDLAVQVYGSVKLARAITIQGEVGVLGLAGTGADVILDIEKNGVSVYTIKPKFVAGVTVLTAGVLDATKVACAAGDVLTFKVTQKGSTIAGQQLRFTLKAKVS